MEIESFTGSGALERIESYTGEGATTLAEAARVDDGHASVSGGSDRREGGDNRGEVESLTGEEAASDAAESFVLDAWYAEFGDPQLVAALQRRLDLASDLLREVVIGVDDRVRVGNTTAIPWRAICSLEIIAADGTRWIGTGWFISPRTVMTAGHCVFMRSHGGWVRSVRVIPGRNGATQPFGSAVGTAFRSVHGWTANNKREYDYGAIVLPEGSALGNSVGWYGFAKLDDAALNQMVVNLAGYPGDKPAGTQWFHSLKIKRVDGLVLTYDIDTAGGQSGAPVWRLLDGQRHAVGVHTNGSLAGNSATRITQPVFDNMMLWKTAGA